MVSGIPLKNKSAVFSLAKYTSRWALDLEDKEKSPTRRALLSRVEHFGMDAGDSQ
jgi:hypothetical protein